MKKLGAGRFNQLVTPLKPTIVKDAAGQEIETLTAQADVWARVKQLRGREFFAAEAAQSSAELIFSIRYRSDVTGRWQWRWKGKTYHPIGEPADVDGGSHTLEIIAAAAGPSV